MTGPRIPLFAALLALAVPAAPAAAAEPDWLVQARAREGTPLERSVVKSEDGWFTAQVPAKLLAKIVLDEGSYGIALDIGAQEQANCEVLREGFDLAALLRSTADLTFERLGQLHGKIEARELERTDAGAFGDSAYIALDWVYLVKADGKPVIGALKQVAATKGGYGIYCSHTDIGYARTFEAAVRSLVETIEVKDPAAAPYYTEISTLAIGGRRIGVNATRMVRDADGDSKVVSASSMIVPVAVGELRAQDSYDIQFVRPDGTLINAKQVTADNGAIDANLSLSPTKDGWSVEGEMKGKKLAQTLAALPLPGSFVAEALMLRGLLAKEKPAGAKQTHWNWMSADPLHLTEVNTEIVGPTEGGYTVRQKAGPITLDSTIDPVTGTALRASIAMGPNTFAIERVRVSGKF